MEAQNSEKDLNFGLIIRELKKKKFPLPTLGEKRLEILLDSLDWYISYMQDKYPSMGIKFLIKGIAEALERRELKFWDIEELRIKKMKEATA